MFSNINWSKKILLLSMFLLSFSLIVGSVGGFFIYQQTKNIRQSIENSRSKTDIAIDARITIIEMDRALKALVAAVNKKDIRKGAIGSIKASSLLDEQIHKLNEELQNNSVVNELKKLIKSIRPVQMKIIRAGKKGLDDEATEYFNEISSSTTRIEKLASQLVDEQRSQIDSDLSNIENQGKHVVQMLAGIVFSAICIGVFISLFASKLIKKPLTSLVNTMQAVSKGDLTYQLPHAGNDEIGQTVDATSATVSMLRKTVGAIKQESDAIHSEANELSVFANNLQSLAEESVHQINQNSDDLQVVQKIGVDITTNLTQVVEQVNHAANTAAEAASDISNSVSKFNIFQQDLQAAFR